MWSLSLDWIILAVLVFWAVGAYNRMMRLRSACVLTFGVLDSHFLQLQALLSEWSAARSWPADSADSAAQLAHAAWQQSLAGLGAALAGARVRPLHAQTLQSLERAYAAQAVAWQALKDLSRAPDEGAEEGAAAQLQAWRHRWQQQQAQTGLASEQFNTAVAQYNAAIAQFPARVLAGFFGFHPARTLQLALGPQLPDSAA